MNYFFHRFSRSNLRWATIASSVDDAPFKEKNENGVSSLTKVRLLASFVL